MGTTTYIDREGLRIATGDSLIGLVTPSGTVLMSPDGARWVRDAITHWLDHREDEEDDDEFLWGFTGIEEDDDE